MGISDEDYANALERQRAHQVALMKLELEKQREEAKMSISGATGLGNLVGAMGQMGAQQTAYPTGITINNNAATNAVWSTNVASVIKTLNEQDLKHDAMRAPLSALVDMWQMRWQGEWVNESEFREDDFWRLALIRLVGANKLEKHHLASQYSAVYRIIE